MTAEEPGDLELLEFTYLKGRDPNILLFPLPFQLFLLSRAYRGNIPPFP